LLHVRHVRQGRRKHCVSVVPDLFLPGPRARWSGRRTGKLYRERNERLTAPWCIGSDLHWRRLHGSQLRTLNEEILAILRPAFRPHVYRRTNPLNSHLTFISNFVLNKSAGKEMITFNVECLIAMITIWQKYKYYWYLLDICFMLKFDTINI